MKIKVKEKEMKRLNAHTVISSIFSPTSSNTTGFDS